MTYSFGSFDAYLEAIVILSHEQLVINCNPYNQTISIWHGSLNGDIKAWLNSVGSLVENK